MYKQLLFGEIIFIHNIKVTTRLLLTTNLRQREAFFTMRALFFLISTAAEMFK